MCLSAVLSLTALADGEIGTGGKACSTNCLVNPETKVTETNKSINEITNDYFNKMLDYFIEIAF